MHGASPRSARRAVYNPSIMAGIEDKLFTNTDLWCSQPVPPSSQYRSPSAPIMQVGFAAPQPQLAGLIVRKKAIPLPEFMKRQHRLLSAKPRHRPIHIYGEQLAWSKGILVAVRPQDSRVRELTEEERKEVRRIEIPITGYLDGRNALENCELCLARLEPEPAVETKLEAPKTHRPLPRGASSARQPGAKRRWFPEGNIVAMRQTEVDFILAGLHGEPIAFETKDRARRHYGPRRLSRQGMDQDDLIIARVTKRFRVEIRCSPEFQHLELDEMVAYARPEMKVFYLPKLCLLKDGTWQPELRDLKNLQRKVLKRPASFNSELLRPLRELADQVTATGGRMDEISLLMEEAWGGKKRLRNLVHELESLGAKLNVPGIERSFCLLPRSILRSMGITSLTALPADVRDNPMMPHASKSLFVRVPYERVADGKSKTRTIELELSRERAVMLHGREFWLIQQTTPQTQKLEKDPMPRIMLPISWEEALDQDGVLAKAV